MSQYGFDIGNSFNGINTFTSDLVITGDLTVNGVISGGGGGGSITAANEVVQVITAGSLVVATAGNIAQATIGNLRGTGQVILANTTQIPSSSINYNITSGSLNIVGDTFLQRGLYFSSGNAAPTLGGRGAGTKIVLFPMIGATRGDYAFGVESNNMWFQVPTLNVEGYRFYQGTTATLAVLPSTGAVSAANMVSNSSTIGNIRAVNCVATGLAHTFGNLRVATSTLSFVGGSAPSSLLVQGSSTARTVDMCVSNNANEFSLSALPGDAVLRCNGAQKMIFQSGTAGGHLIIASSGNIGIGSTSPSQLLTVGGTITSGSVSTTNVESSNNTTGTLRALTQFILPSISSTSNAPAGNTRGSVYFNSASLKAVLFDGSNWSDL